MGNYSEFCGCKKDEELYKPREGLMSEEDKYNFAGIQAVPTELKNTSINTTSLIRQRTDNFNKYYEKQQKLGSGTFGTVYKVKMRSGNNYRAMKIINKKAMRGNGKEEEELMQNEIRVLECLDHPYIMKIYETFVDDDNIYIISELCDKGCIMSNEDLDKCFKLPEIMIRYFSQKLLEAVDYLHSKKIFHGDIKPDNILIETNSNKDVPSIQELADQLFCDSDLNKELSQKLKKHEQPNLSEKAQKFMDDLSNYEIKLVDFGCSRLFKKKPSSNNEDSDKQHGVLGTYDFCSPELTRDEYYLVSDEWACGVTIYLFATHDLPYDGDTVKELVDAINKNEPDYENGFEDISDDLITVIKSLLITDVKVRKKAKDVLNLPFFTQPIAAFNYLENKVDISILSSLKNSLNETNTSKFKDAVIAYITLNYIEKGEETKIKNIFTALTHGAHDSKIDKKIFTENLKKISPLTYTEIENIYEKMDSDKNGYIEYQELLRALIDKKKLLNDAFLENAFDLFDKNSDGHISWEEIENIVFSGQKTGEKIMKDFYNEIGHNENREIDIEEFKSIMRK